MYPNSCYFTFLLVRLLRHLLIVSFWTQTTQKCFKSHITYKLVYFHEINCKMVSSLCLAFKVHDYVCERFPLIIKAFSFSTQYGEYNMAYTALDTCKRSISINMPAHGKRVLIPQTNSKVLGELDVLIKHGTLGTI